MPSFEGNVLFRFMPIVTSALTKAQAKIPLLTKKLLLKGYI